MMSKKGIFSLFLNGKNAFSVIFCSLIQIIHIFACDYYTSNHERLPEDCRCGNVPDAFDVVLQPIGFGTISLVP